MSDQSKSNIQALGAGFLGFVAVVTVGGGLMLMHSSRQAQSSAKPAPAAAPIDLGSSGGLPAAASSSMPRERRAESPAPLIGDEGKLEPDSSPSSSAAPSAAAKAAAGQAKAASAPALKPTEHLKADGASTSAAAIVKNTIEAEKPAKAADEKLVPAAKLPEPSGAGAVASSVHYGVTDRSELMGRAAGPVYNFKGTGGTANSGAAAAAAQSDVQAKLAGLKKQLEDSNLPAEQRAAILKQLAAADPAGAAPAK